MRRAALLLSVALLAAACDREAERAAEAPAAVAPAAPAAPAPSPAASDPTNGPALALDGQGLRLVDRASGGTRAIPFGTPEAAVLAALHPLRGPPTERANNDECPAGPMAFAEWEDYFQLVFQDGRFVGWWVDDPGLTTMSGLGVGSSRADLDAAYKAEVGESTLGPEFSAGGLGGLLSTRGPTARVTTLWAGTICAFR